MDLFEDDDSDDLDVGKPAVPVSQSLLTSDTARAHFPCFDCPPGCPAYKKNSELLRLSTLNLDFSKFIAAPQAKRLIAAMLSAHRVAETQLSADMASLDASSADVGSRLGLGLAFIFDMVTNAAYLHTRVDPDRWIHCTHFPERDGPEGAAYFSFLKQCPACSLHHGIEKRIGRAQHKPSSHHIGEITATITGLMLRAFTETLPEETHIGLVTKQSHDADALAFCKSFIVLFEVKSSPLVTYPLLMKRPPIAKQHEPISGNSHLLVDVEGDEEISLFIPNGPIEISLGRFTDTCRADFPYRPLVDWFSQPENYILAFRAWLEVYRAYEVPKTARQGRQKHLAFLTNGWGDEIDSNKTKAGLGRTDDLKKGTYQLLKYGAYYRERCQRKAYTSCLAANLDPLFHSALYLDELVDIRWFREGKLKTGDGSSSVSVAETNFLYDAIFTFNNPRVNRPELRQLFSVDRLAAGLLDGQLDMMLSDWLAWQPETNK